MMRGERRWSSHLLLLFVLISGCHCQTLTLHDFVPSASCPSASSDWINTTGIADMTGVDTSNAFANVELIDPSNRSIDSTSWGTCSMSSGPGFFCTSSSNDVYNIVFKKKAIKAYSGMKVKLRILNSSYKIFAISGEIIYPLVREALVESLHLGGDPWPVDSTEYEGSNDVAVRYGVTGMGDLPFELKILNADTQAVLNSSTSSSEITATVDSTVNKIKLYYSVNSTCEKTSSSINLRSVGSASLGGGELAGIIIGCLLAVVIIGVIIFLLWRRLKNKQQITRFTCSSKDTLDTVWSRMKREDFIGSGKLLDGNFYHQEKKLEKSKKVEGLLSDTGNVQKSSGQVTLVMSYKLVGQRVDFTITDIKGQEIGDSQCQIPMQEVDFKGSEDKKRTQHMGKGDMDQVDNKH